ncbi:MAG TPA: SMC-Scp complex subunit ScpB [Candidatus Paceibacterota bacterium]
MNNEQKIEALLYFKNEPVEIAWLEKFLKQERAVIEEALTTLEASLIGRGVVLVRAGDTVQLGTAPDVAELIEQITKDELGKELSKASLETLSIILYQEPVTRSQIDYVRGVNSQFIVRHLLVRGLIERIDNPNDARSFLYQPTLKLLSHLGLTKIADLPNYADVKRQLEAISQNADATPTSN